MSNRTREQEIYRATVIGALINLVLCAFKLLSGMIGHSQAMVTDALHSMTDLATDFVVLLFVKISSRPQDQDHDYGHGKYETLASQIIGLALLLAGGGILWSALGKLLDFISGEQIPQPGLIALWAALLSILLKEAVFRYTRLIAHRTQSTALEANAWHHRSDALSSIGTALGISGAILLGDKFAILDAISALVVSLFILKEAIRLIQGATEELLEKSLPKHQEERIMEIVQSHCQVSDIHNLRTRKIGNRLAMEMHLRLPGDLSLAQAHEISREIEESLRKEFGSSTHIMLHIEPQKKA